MTQDDCTRMRLLVQAGTDGELSAADAAAVAVHLQGCAACATVERRLIALSSQLRRDAPRHAAPAALHAAVLARLAAGRPLRRLSRSPSHRGSMPHPAAVFAAGLAVAAGLAFAIPSAREGSLASMVAAGHIRALQPGHLLDVPSGDQHTVKPWFDGRLDFAPPVKDLGSGGFPLQGGRLDYIAGRAVAALVYGRRQHVIELFVWPDHAGDAAPVSDAYQGYNMLRWRREGMAFWAVSDVAPQEVAEFAQQWLAD